MQTGLGSLRYFAEVARTGSIREASERLHVATSAISRQVAKLEHEAGVPLFERQPRGMVLTAAGEVLAAYARRRMREEEQVLDEMRELHAGQRRTVEVASSEGFAQDVLPEAMASFRAQHPGVRFRLHVTTPAAATRQVVEGVADLAVTFSTAPEQGIRVEHSERHEIRALVRADHPLAERAEAELADLLPYPLALMEEGTTLRQLFDICCSMEGLQFDPVFVSNHSIALHSFARLSGGVTLTGRLSVRRRLDQEGLVAIPLTNPELLQRNLQIQTMAQRRLPAPVRDFVDHLIGTIRDD
ncbi:LysR family transcriptional regulator [Saccharopolyspora sp. NPDC002686]|uniref:LysR family transcriptional regulator n=1 Tax=Saccharopolyspora sp. NPDC002686 TaxID=3154541 RepID=UPI00331E144E